jgi:hypothetical protein
MTLNMQQAQDFVDNSLTAIKRKRERTANTIRLNKSAPILLKALKNALLEMEFVNRKGAQITIREARNAIIKATGVAP